MRFCHYPYNNHRVILIFSNIIMTTKVLLHKDKHMRVAKEDETNQPVQLELWKMMVSQNYSNSVELYQTLPDVFS